MNIQQGEEKRIPFADPGEIFAGLSKTDIAQLVDSAGDFVLALDSAGTIRDVSAPAGDYPVIHGWIGCKWVDTVTTESRDKIAQLWDGSGPADRDWRQVNHMIEGEEDFPVRYRLIGLANGEWSLAIGRDLRPVSQLQQRLLRTQQSMERDYLNLRQAETRYRVLFDNIAYPVVIVDRETRKIQQANRAGELLLGASGQSLEGRNFLDLLTPSSRDDALVYFGALAVSAIAEPISVQLRDREDPVFLLGSIFRQGGRQFLLVNMNANLNDARNHTSDRYVLDVVERMPDAFVLTNQDQDILVANMAFAEMVQAHSVDQLIGMSLADFIGRPAIDMNLLTKQLKSHHNAKNFGSIINDLNGNEEPVEISATMIEREQPLYGYSLRSVGRRERDLPPDPRDLRSVEQLTELVGRKPLKEIVRESTDLIERMCIEAALTHTSDNRASAAEILGLSRQSLYSKLHRFGLGNLGDKDE